MLTEERYKIILQYLAENGSVTVTELTERLSSSESTVRRDLNTLDAMGKLVKVHGGATAIDANFSYIEHSIETKEKLYVDEKNQIAKYAAQTICKDDFIFIDAGTTTEKMIDFITEHNITVVTNGFSHAKKLAMRGFRVFILGGQIKTATESVVGTESLAAIEKYNFTKCFLGVNGICVNSGFTTPDIDEANIKRAVAQRSHIAYVLADHSKFDKISSVSFSPLSKACIITDKLPDEKFKAHCIIHEASA